jgi:hypothetical protein
MQGQNQSFSVSPSQRYLYKYTTAVQNDNKTSNAKIVHVDDSKGANSQIKIEIKIKPRLISKRDTNKDIQ